MEDIFQGKSPLLKSWKILNSPVHFKHWNNKVRCHTEQYLFIILIHYYFCTSYLQCLSPRPFLFWNAIPPKKIKSGLIVFTDNFLGRIFTSTMLTNQISVFLIADLFAGIFLQKTLFYLFCLYFGLILVILNIKTVLGSSVEPRYW